MGHLISIAAPIIRLAEEYQGMCGMSTSTQAKISILKINAVLEMLPISKKNSLKTNYNGRIVRDRGGFNFPFRKMMKMVEVEL